MTKHILFCIVTMLIWSLAAPPGDARTHVSSRAPIHIPLTSYQLPNGLTVLLAPDRSGPPAISLCLCYRVGSRNEQPGQAGLAHLVEHMMFEGSANVGRGEHSALIRAAGGEDNAGTAADYTEYHETVPSNQLDLVLYLEADRIHALDMTQLSLDNQRSVVLAEERSRHEGIPFDKVTPEFLRLSYTRFAYAHAGIGKAEDLNAVTLASARAFYARYYLPNNAVLALAGNFDVRVAKSRINHYFGAIPRGETPPDVDVSEPPAPGPLRTTLTDNFTRLPRLAISYLTPPATDPDTAPLMVLASIVGVGKSSRLSKALVASGRVQRVRAAEMWHIGPGRFEIDIDPPAGGAFAPLEADTMTILAGICDNGVTAAEVAKAKNRMRAIQLDSLYSSEQRAKLLAITAVIMGDPNGYNAYVAKLEAVTAADLRRAARKSLQPAHRIVVTDSPG